MENKIYTSNGKQYLFDTHTWNRPQIEQDPPDSEPWTDVRGITTSTWNSFVRCKICGAIAEHKQWGMYNFIIKWNDGNKLTCNELVVKNILE